MVHEVRWTALALSDVEQDVVFVAKDSPAYAKLLRDKLFDLAGTLAEFPNRGRARQDLTPAGIREVFEGSYRMLYLLDSRTVFILLVAHVARDLPRIWKKRSRVRRKA